MIEKIHNPESVGLIKERDINPIKTEKNISEDDGFRMSVYYVSSIWGRGIVVGGMVEHGSIIKDEKISILTSDGSWKNAVVAAIHTTPDQKESSERANTGEQILFLMQGINERLKAHDVKEGAVLIGRPVSSRDSNDSETIYNAEIHPAKTQEKTVADPEVNRKDIYDAEWVVVEESGED